MKKIAYAVVIIIGCSVIADWLYVNYQSFQWGKRTAALIDTDIRAHKIGDHFAVCREFWDIASSEGLKCEHEQTDGYSVFARSWAKHDTSSTVPLMSCWQLWNGVKGTNWANAADCAVTQGAASARF